MKRLAAMVGVLLLGGVLLAQTPLTAIMNLRGRTDANGVLMVANSAPSGAETPLTTLANLRGKTDGNGYLMIGLAATQFGDGLVGSPTITFASTPTLGFYKSAAAVMGLAGSLTSNGSLTAAVDVAVGAAGFLHFTGRGGFDTASNGNFRVQIESGAVGTVLKVDNLPVASACGGGAPAVVAGSTALSGSVTVGTGGPITCTITYGGTAFPSAPHCSGSVETITAANTRAMGYSSTTTVLTIVPSAAWVDSSVVNWTCMSAK